MAIIFIIGSIVSGAVHIIRGNILPFPCRDIDIIAARYPAYRVSSIEISGNGLSLNPCVRVQANTHVTEWNIVDGYATTCRGLCVADSG
jgi:hypothetical protein